MLISLLQWEQELMLIQMELELELLLWFKHVKLFRSELIFMNMLKTIKN
jgi:hypothetical protein